METTSTILTWRSFLVTQAWATCIRWRPLRSIWTSKLLMYLWMRISYQKLRILGFQACLIDSVLQDYLPEHLMIHLLILGNNRHTYLLYFLHSLITSDGYDKIICFQCVVSSVQFITWVWWNFLLHDQNEGIHELELFHTKRCLQFWCVPCGVGERTESRVWSKHHSMGIFQHCSPISPYYSGIIYSS